MRALVDAHILLPAVVRVPHAVGQADPPRYDKTVSDIAPHTRSPTPLTPASPFTAGYPLILEGFPLSGSGSWIGIILFNWSMRVPFLWEARAFVDWTVETTSLDIWSWMKLEDIYAGLQVTGRHCHHRHHRHHHQHRHPNLTPLLPSGCSSRGT